MLWINKKFCYTLGLWTEYTLLPLWCRTKQRDWLNPRKQMLMRIHHLAGILCIMCLDSIHNHLHHCTIFQNWFELIKQIRQICICTPQQTHKNHSGIHSCDSRCLNGHANLFSFSCSSLIISSRAASGLFGKSMFSLSSLSLTVSSDKST